MSSNEVFSFGELKAARCCKFFGNIGSCSSGTGIEKNSV